MQIRVTAVTYGNVGLAVVKAVDSYRLDKLAYPSIVQHDELEAIVKAVKAIHPEIIYYTMNVV